jgi:hypothetical protein
MRRLSAEIRYVWLVGGIAVLLLDLGGALASRLWGFDARALAPVSFILYFCAGAGGGRLAGVLAGGFAGAVASLVDATLGQVLAAALGGPGSRGEIGTAALVALGVVVTGFGLGVAGGVLGKVVHSHLADPTER